MAVFSFHPVKIITTGEGGILVTNNKKIFEKTRTLRSHGITRDAKQFKGASPGDWYYEQLNLGFNYRMTDIQAALGSSQLKKVDYFVKSRHQIAARYTEAFSDLPFFLPTLESEHFRSSMHLYILQLDEQHPLSRKTCTII